MLEFKRISEDTLEVMRNAAGSDEDYYSIAVNKIRDLFNCDDTFILNSANSCLLVVAEAISEPVLVADMGGWNGFIKACDVFDKNVEYLQTDDGLINPKILEDYFKSSEIKSLYVTSLAGYAAQQPLKQIAELCDAYDVLLIVDISGSVGDKELNKYGDIQVSSTGSPKIINIENGGFINSFSDKTTLNRHLLKTLKADNITCAGIANEIDKISSIQEKTIEANKYLKEKIGNKLSDDKIHNILHPDKIGLNTIVTAESKSKAKKLAYNIRQNLKTNGNIISVGPSYNRIKKASIIIETKNLDVSSLTKENMDYLCDVIIDEIEKMGRYD